MIDLRILFAASVLLISVCDRASAAIAVEKAWVRAPVPSIKVTAGYAVITNNGNEGDELLSISSPLAKSIELHLSKSDGGMMSMDHVERLDIPVGGKVELTPGGYHLMIQGLTAPLGVGEKLDLTFTFKKAGPVNVEAIITPLSAIAHP